MARAVGLEACAHEVFLIWEELLVVFWQISRLTAKDAGRTATFAKIAQLPFIAERTGRKIGKIYDRLLDEVKPLPQRKNPNVKRTENGFVIERMCRQVYIASAVD